MTTSRGAIGDYAIIGDCRTAALVSRAGSIDWLCWPRFDSPSLFGALLDDDGGRWSLAPTAPFEARRAYVDGTNVLQTIFETDGGRVVVTDFMPVASEEDKRRLLMADHEILRIVSCERGAVELEQRFEPRPAYGRRARLIDAGAFGLRVEAHGGRSTLRSELPLTPGDDGARGVATLRAGEVRCASLTFAGDAPAVLPPLGLWSRRALARSIAWWRAWSARLCYEGPLREAVLRSALAIKLLVYAPSGAVVAAPWTSLP
ncbi:MAG: trehalase-like domain-containing protein, partial [Polyangia bacterium]